MALKSMMLLLALVLGPIGATFAETPSPPAWLSAGDPCPILLTEAECTHLRLVYAALTSTTEREALLYLLHETLLDREAACLCLRAEMSAIDY